MSINNSSNNAIRNDMRNPKLTGIYSWPIIIVFLIFFFPVAIFLMYKRFSVDKANVIKNAKITRNLGIAAIAFGLFYAVMALTGNVETTEESMEPIAAALTMLAILGGGGVLLFFISLKMKKNGIKHTKYIRTIVNQGHTTIDNIAANAGVTYETALKDLHQMIEHGYLGGCYIDEANREIVFLKTQTTYNISENRKVVSCKNCGANTSVSIGRATECEYCGTPIEI